MFALRSRVSLRHYLILTASLLLSGYRSAALGQAVAGTSPATATTDAGADATATPASPDAPATDDATPAANAPPGSDPAVPGETPSDGDAAAASEPTEGSERATLQFSFREQEWIEVLDWFARQADLSLVVNELPPGSFTYSDTRSYTPTEALDLMNGVLGTRGFTLVRRNRMLICANLTEGIPEGLVPRVQLDDLDNYGQFELVEVMFPLGKRPAAGVVEEITPLLGKYGKATPLPQTSQLLVTTTAGTMRAVNAIITSIPEPQPAPPKPKDPPPPAPVLAVYPGKDFDSKSAVEMIQTLVPEAKITVDGQSGQLNIYATSAQHDVVKQVLEQLGTTTANEFKPRLELYDIQHDAPATLIQQLKLIVPAATLSYDDARQRIVAFGPPAQHDELRLALQKLEAGGQAAATQQPVVYSLRHADPATVSTMLQAMFPRATITVDAATQRLVVLADPDQQLAARSFIEQLEAQPAREPIVRHYPLEATNAAATQSLLQSLVPTATLTYDPATRQLMVVAADREQTRIVGLLEQLRQAPAAATSRALQRYDVTQKEREQFLRHYLQLAPELSEAKQLDSGNPTQLLFLATPAEHARVASVLEEVRQQFPDEPRQLRFFEADAALQARFQSLRAQLAPNLGELQLVEQAGDPRLGIVGTTEQHRQIQLLLDELRRELPAVTQQLRIFPVTPTQRSRFLALQPSLDAQLKSVRIIDEARPQELVVWGTPTQLQLIESLLPSLQTSTQDPTLELIAYPLREGDPASVQKVLTELYPDVKIIVDPESRRVMIWTTAEQQRLIEQTILQLDTPGATGKQRMAYYRLGEVDVREVEPMLRTIVPKMSLVADRSSNSIVAWGNDKDHATLEATVADFAKQQTARANAVISYPSGTVPPERLRLLLSEVVPDARIVSDEPARKLIVWASPDSHRAVQQALQEITAAGDTSEASLQSYPLTRVAGADVRTLLLEIAPTAEVTLSSDGKQVFVWTTAAQHQTIHQALEQIQAGDPREQQAVARAYRSQPAVVKQVEQLLAQVAPGARLLPDTQAGLLLVWASNEEHQLVTRLIDSLADVSTTPSEMLVTYVLERATPAQARELIISLAPDAKFLTTADPQQLLVRTTATDHELIGATLQQLEQAIGAPTPQQVVVYPLGKVPPATISPLLPPELLTGVTVVPDATRNALIIRAKAEQHQAISVAIQAILTHLPAERKRETRVYRLEHSTPTALSAALTSLLPTASISVDAEARSVLVTAYSEDHEQVQAAVTQLDQPQTAQRQTRVYKLGSRDFFGLRSALQELVPSAVVASDRASRMLLVTASETDQARIAEVIDQLSSGGADTRSTKVYRLLNTDAEAAAEALEALLPNAVIRGDNSTRTLLLTAEEADQTRATEVIAQLNNTPSDDLKTQAYPLTNGDVRAARDAIQSLLPEATVAADFDNRSLVVTCRAIDQQRVAEAITQLDQPNVAGIQTQVYHLQFGDVEAARDALADLLPRGSVAADRINRLLIVTASAGDQARVKTAVAQMDVAHHDPSETRVYALQRGDAVAVQRALEALLPNAVFANDPAQRTLLATATPAEHERIAIAVQNMDRRSSQEPTLQAYVVTQANLQSVLTALKSMYDRNPLVALSADDTNHSILAKAPPQEQLTIAQIVSQMENGAAAGGTPQLIAYPITSVKNDTLLATLQKLFEKQQPAIQLSLNADTQQLVAVATPAQHAMLSAAVRQIQRDPVQVEVFPLQTADPFSIELAIDRLYEGEANRPIANGDSATQQLFVRGTAPQLAAVRELLAKMGELPEADPNSQRGTRVVPFRGDVRGALLQLQDVWPRLRPNRLQIVTPPADGLPHSLGPRVETREPGSEPGVTRDNDDSPADLEQEPLPQQEPRQLPQPRTEPERRPQPQDLHDDSSASSDRRPFQTQGVASEEQPAVNASVTDASQPPAPVILVPSAGSITILSDDEVALNQAESLLRTLARQSLTDVSSGNFAVYTLRNAGARNMAKTLTELFEQMPITTRATLGRVSMVADDRMNAVIVHGRPADRAVIEELLRVLDSANVPDSLANARPKIVAVQYMEAGRVMNVLQGIYASQLKSGGSRPEIEIPKGVSSDVATLLRQINAASSGPLLTLEVDEVTNSVVILAPPQLSDEVAALVARLDTNAQHNDARDVGIVTLRGTNVKQLEPAINELLRPRSRRASGR